jgi:hypothetical protein
MIQSVPGLNHYMRLTTITFQAERTRRIHEY